MVFKGMELDEVTRERVYIEREMAQGLSPGYSMLRGWGDKYQIIPGNTICYNKQNQR